ncbi:YrrS family protein [Bacillus suaedae]|uniref:YrrS family protein n=1 Tax=Halalkalibacter suaedae TaxID=2822140 RepID=A0A940WRW7_9BACI|nr:YrrS family protein [Bacillus suaedae]MBP3951365.1 YrrS family protein [Bacillus suaedae]
MSYRYKQRKKQRLNTILNIAIVVVIALIGVFAAQIFLGGNNSEVALNEQELETENETNEQAPVDSITDPSESEEETGTDTATNEDIETEEEETEQDQEPVQDGEWEPIGTEQTGEFTPNFSQDSVNWQEMMEALRYATGLDENMIPWRVENGGSPTRVRGVVSDPANQGQPYEVFIEWVDGQGWTPVEKKQLTSNPYQG